MEDDARGSADGVESVVGVSAYLERARECAALAETMKPADKKAMLEIAEAWAALAKEEAERLAKADGKPPK